MGIGHVVPTDSLGAFLTRPPNSTVRAGGLVQPGAWGQVRMRSPWRREASTHPDRGPRRTAAAEQVTGSTQQRRAVRVPVKTSAHVTSALHAVRDARTDAPAARLLSRGDT